MAQMKQSGGIIDVVLELGFDDIKYFEITATTSAQSISMSVTARRLTLRNTSETIDFYFNVKGVDAAASVSSTPGDNIRVGAGCVYEADYDSLTTISFITEAGTAAIQGHLGWKGSGNC